jgi:hypothetical protein
MTQIARTALVGVVLFALAAGSATALAPHGTWKGRKGLTGPSMEFNLLPGAPVRGKPRSLQPGGLVQIPVPELNDCYEPGERGLFETPLGSGNAYYQIGKRFFRSFANGREVIDLRYKRNDTWVGSYHFEDDDWYCDNDMSERAVDATATFTLRCADPVCGKRRGVAVPALIGKSKAEAVSILRKKGLKARVRVVRRGSGYPGTATPQVKVGRVTLHYPSYGKRQKRGGKVLLYVRGERPGRGGPPRGRNPR